MFDPEHIAAELRGEGRNGIKLKAAAKKGGKNAQQAANSKKNRIETMKKEENNSEDEELVEEEKKGDDKNGRNKKNAKSGNRMVPEPDPKEEDQDQKRMTRSQVKEGEKEVKPGKGSRLQREVASLQKASAPAPTPPPNAKKLPQKGKKDNDVITIRPDIVPAVEPVKEAVEQPKPKASAKGSKKGNKAAQPLEEIENTTPCPVNGQKDNSNAAAWEDARKQPTNQGLRRKICQKMAKMIQEKYEVERDTSQLLSVKIEGYLREADPAMSEDYKTKVYILMKILKVCCR